MLVVKYRKLDVYREDRLNDNLEVTNTNNKIKSITKTNKLF